MKYKCIVLDHDDTTVSSTASIHFPAFAEYLKLVRPNETITLDEYIIENFHSDFAAFCRRKYDFTDDELKKEEIFWKKYHKGRAVKAYDGMKDLITKQKADGGYICVVSYNFSKSIIRDCNKNLIPMPDMIFGLDLPVDQRKPYTYPLVTILDKYKILKKDIMVIDDAKPGIDMANKFGVDSAAAGWSNDIAEIQNHLKQNSKYYFKSVFELSNFLKN